MDTWRANRKMWPAALALACTLAGCWGGEQPPPNRAPAPRISQPSDGAVFTTAEMIDFAGDCSDPEDGVVTGGALVWESDLSGVIDSGATFAVALPPGNHVITLTATDSDGATGTASVTIIVHEPPTAEIVAPADGALFPTGAIVNLAGSGSDAEDGALPDAALQWVSDRDGALGTGASLSTALTSGLHRITLTVADSRGATGSASITVTLNDSPSVVILAPASGVVLVADYAVTLSGSGTDPEDGPLTGAALAWSSSLDGPLGTGASLEATLSPGDHEITLTATDGLGASAVASVTVLVHEPPSTEIAAPAAGEVFTTDESIAFVGSGVDPEDGPLTGEALSWSSSLDGPLGTGEAITVSLSPGDHEITLTAVDSRGAVGSVSLPLVVHTRPAVTITAPATGATLTTDEVVVLTGTATDVEDGALAGEALIWTSSLDGELGTGENASVALSAGNHVLTLTATDSQGATGSDSVTVTVTAAASPPVNTTGPDFINAGAATTTAHPVVLAISATDNVGVTGWCGQATPTAAEPPAPSLGDPCWTAVPSAPSYSAAVPYDLGVQSDGAEAWVHVWFRDAAGNLSGAASDSILCADDMPPENTTGLEFINDGAPTTSVRSVTLTLSATDNWAVGAWCAVDNDQGGDAPDPSPGDACWVPTTPTPDLALRATHALAAYGPGTEVTVTVWFRDVNGFVSGPATDTILIAAAAPPVYEYAFEGGWGPWWTDNGVWQVGVPTSGPRNCIEGTQCAGTILNGDYPGDTDSRLISASIDLPATAGDEELQLRYQEWFSYGACDYGQVQVSVQDPDTGEWAAWVALDHKVNRSSPWSVGAADLTPYAGERVRLAFLHVATTSTYPSDCRSSGAGWYLDDVEIARKVPEFSGDFETGWADWSASNGVWQVGNPADEFGPGECHESSGCAGTVLDGNHPGNTDSRLISPSTRLAAVVGEEELQLRYREWFSFGACDYGQVQVSVQDPDTGEWAAWVALDHKVNRSSPWSVGAADLTPYAGERVRLAFLHVATTSTYPSDCRSSGAGWYLDDVEIARKVPEFSGDFETGWADWSASNGVWQVGTPTAGPEGCYAGTGCAGTVLDGNHPGNTDSRLTSPPFDLPVPGFGQEVHVRYLGWFSFGACDGGEVQISTLDPSTGAWSAWQTAGTGISGASPWSPVEIDLTPYAGQRTRLGFYHFATTSTYPNDCRSSGVGWYLDNITVLFR